MSAPVEAAFATRDSARARFAALSRRLVICTQATRIRSGTFSRIGVGAAAARLPLRLAGVWRSLVARSVRVGEVPSSNLGTPMQPALLRNQVAAQPGCRGLL